ncbi:peptidase inhibitor family I36 protein [Streptomyces sp. NPDC090025]|uniref:peptidase inhibitor family I36 protein n=1 Tax=Streptomyces sp. NPDC090025 TaxID=3365922 RepID=UPI00383557D3
MKRLLGATAAAVLTLAGGLALTAPATAADCPSGHFCAWTDANFDGQRTNWSGDDGWWEGSIPDADSSWANHGLSGPGIKDHVKVYESAWQGGAMTICLAPGEEVGYDANANDRGDSHTWTMGC